MKLVQSFKYEGTIDEQYVGQSIKINGNTCVVKMENWDTGGLVYVYEKINGNWEKTSEFRPDVLGSGFGASCDVYGNTIVISAHNDVGDNLSRIYIYEKILGKWKLVSSPKAENSGDDLGYQVSVSDNFIAAGSKNFNSNVGKVYLYKKHKRKWNLHSTLDGETSSQFGFYLCINNNFLVIAGPSYSSEFGKVYIYKYEKDTWNKIDEKLGEVAGARFGSGVSINNNYLVIVDKYYSAFVYEYINQKWSLTFKFDNPGGTNTASFISNISISNNIIVLGNKSIGNGKIYFFIKNKNNWTQFDVLTGEDNENSGFGNSVSVNDSYIAIGSINWNNNRGKFILYEIKY